jgi:hypothetical protein
MVNGNVPPLRPLRLFPLIAGLPANWYQTTAKIIVMLTGGSISPRSSESQGMALRNQRDGSLHSP